MLIVAGFSRFICTAPWCDTASTFLLRLPSCRRFLDLLAHYQIKRWLAGEETLTGPSVMMEISAGDGAVQIANRVRPVG